MSATSQSNDEQSQNNYTREPAVRATVEEINQAKDQFKTSDASRAPSYQLLPTGVGANRVFTAGTLTAVEDVSKANDGSYLQATISSGTGTVYAYAGQYSEAARSFLQDAETPQFVAVCGKMDMYDEKDPVEERNVSLDPEWIQGISGDRRDEILLKNALATIERADGAGMDALVERAEEKYANDEDFLETDFRAGAVGVLEDLDSVYAEEAAESDAEQEKEPAKVEA